MPCRFYVLLRLTLQTQRDTVVQRIFRLGLIKCARSLQGRGIYDEAQYLWPRDAVSIIVLKLQQTIGRCSAHYLSAAAAAGISVDDACALLPFFLSAY